MDRINMILQRTFKLPLEKITENLSMEEVRDWDSLTHMDLILNIESEFNIMISGDDIAEMTTFDSIRSVVSKYIKAE